MIEVYTDGAASNNGKEDAVGGAAWVILKDGEKVAEGMRKIAPATNNICELVGVVEGVCGRGYPQRGQHNGFIF